MPSEHLLVCTPVNRRTAWERNRCVPSEHLFVRPPSARATLPAECRALPPARGRAGGCGESAAHGWCLVHATHGPLPGTALPPTSPSFLFPQHRLLCTLGVLSSLCTHTLSTLVWADARASWAHGALPAPQGSPFPAPP